MQPTVSAGEPLPHLNLWSEKFKGKDNTLHKGLCLISDTLSSSKETHTIIFTVLLYFLVLHLHLLPPLYIPTYLFIITY